MRASFIATIAALPLLAGAALAQEYRSYDGVYRPYSPSLEAREQHEIDQLNTSEIRAQDRLDRVEDRRDQAYEEAYRQWRRDYADWQAQDEAARRWNQHDRFQRENRVGSGWCYYPGAYDRGWSC